jgi:hypothetical protein
MRSNRWILPGTLGDQVFKNREEWRDETIRNSILWPEFVSFPVSFPLHGWGNLGEFAHRPC